MILFIFEGKKTEPNIFKTIKSLYFARRSDEIICSYNNNIYNLFLALKKENVFDIDNSVNTFSVFKKLLNDKGDSSLNDYREDSVSEIFLFFDYDFQNKFGSLTENNQKVSDMLNYFNEETEAGKLYINYPMVESLFYTKKLPDNDYFSYVVERSLCSGFKDLTHKFSAYSSYDHLLLPSKSMSDADLSKRISNLHVNWNHVINMNVSKAYYICDDCYSIPENKDDIKQTEIFRSQLSKYISRPDCVVSVLNSFPLFVFEYFKQY